MSSWTHAFGCLRLDEGYLIKDPKDPESIINHITNMLTAPANWDSEKSIWDCCELPCGSEGSLQYKIEALPDTDECMEFNKAQILFWGDLRDFAEKEIETILIPWIENLPALVKKNEYSIRDFIMAFRQGVNNSYCVYIYDCVEDKMVKIKQVS